MINSTNQGENSQLNRGGSFITEADGQIDVYSDKKKNEVTNDLIPDELLFALKQMDSSSDKPPVVNENGELLKEVLKKGPPAGLWHHKSRRKNFKHLTNKPRSNGDRVGTRDVSFLYDCNAIGFSSKINLAEDSGDKESLTKLKIPGKIAENEFNLVKTKKVRSLKFLDSKDTTELVDVEKKLRVFPSLQPAKRHEVVQLLKTFDYMLKKSGVDDESVEINGPSQIHHLLELVKKEQKMYDLAFSEVIRQVSVGCIERGQLLSKLRTRYADLLSRIPRQVKSLHTEVLAQRALDRRLTEQLELFKMSILTLTSELSQMKHKDEVVTAETEDVRNNLELALTDSKENARLVEEYHTLYELQRKRLETSINILTEEKEMWAKSAMSLSKKIVASNELVTSKKLSVTEEGWYNVAMELNAQLKNADQQNIEDVQKYVQNWKETITDVGSSIDENDRRTGSHLSQMKEEADTWLKKIEDSYIIQVEEDVENPTTELTKELAELYNSWDEKLDTALERYDGDYAFEQAEKLDEVDKQLETMADVALRIFRRHKNGEGEIHELGPQMNDILNRIKALEEQLNVRVAGDHGVADDLRTMKKQVTTWNTKLSSSQSKNFELQHGQLMQIYDQMVGVTKLTKSSRNKLSNPVFKAGKADKVSQELLRIDDVVSEVSDWSREVTISIQASNGKLQNESSRIHQKMTQWMIESVLYLAPDAEEEYSTSRDSFTLQLTPEELQSKAEMICEEIAEFTAYLSDSVEDVVTEKKHENEQLGINDRLWQEYAEMKNEAREWIATAEIVLKKISGRDIKLLNEKVAKKLVPPKAKNIPRDSTGTRQKGGKKERESTENKKKSIVKMNQLAKAQEKFESLIKSRKIQDDHYTKDGFKKAKKMFEILRKQIQPNRADKNKFVEIVKELINTTENPSRLKINDLDPELFSVLTTKEIDKILEEAKEERQVKMQLCKKVEEPKNTTYSKPAEGNEALIEEVSVTEVDSKEEIKSAQTSVLPEQSQITDVSTLKINDDPSGCFGHLRTPQKVKVYFSEDVHSQNLPSLPTSSQSPDKLVFNLGVDSQIDFFTNTSTKLPKETKQIEVPYQDNAGDARLSQLNVTFLSNVEVNAIGEDTNVTKHVLNDASFNELVPPCSKLTQEALDAIANVDRLQQELIDTEVRAQQAEELVISLQEQVIDKNQKITELEKIINDLKGREASEHSLEPVAESVVKGGSTTLTELHESSRKNSKGGKRKTPSPKKKSRSKK